MKKGLIICGYPGVGKSSVAGWNNCIDLESSLFSHRNDALQKTIFWVPQYCQVATHLALQGYTVLISTHMDVINYFTHHNAYNAPTVVIFCPKRDMKAEWASRLMNRWLKTNYEKDLRAFEGAINYWDKKIGYAINCGLHVYSPCNIDYDLKDYILRIRELEGCNGDSKTNPPVESLAGVEESSLDVPVVEKDSGISEAEPQQLVRKFCRLEK